MPRPKITEARQRTTLYLPDKIHQALKVRAAKEGRTMSDIVINAIKKDRPERVPPPQGETHEVTR